MKRIMNMPMVAACAAVRQTRDTSATGCGSLIASGKRRWRGRRYRPAFHAPLPRFHIAKVDNPR